MKTLQIQGRNLTPGEEKYARKWLEMGFPMESVAIAYDRTCVNTGGMNWKYINKILTRWYEAGLLTPEQIEKGDSKPGVPKGASGQLGAAELAAIQRVLQED
jgi:DnaD/phage-associated family protein